MRRAIVSSGLAVGITRLAGAGLGLGVTVLLGRYLGPEGLGTYGYALIVLSLLAVPVSNGWSTVVLRRVSGALHNQHWAEPKGMLIRGVQLAGVWALCVLLLAFAGYGVAVEKFPGLAQPWLWGLLAAVLFFDQVSALRQSTLRGLNFPVWSQWPEMVLRPALIIAAFWLIATVQGTTPTLANAIVALACGSALAAVAGGAVLKHKAPQGLAEAQPAYLTREWVMTAGLLAGNSLLLILNTTIDTLFLGALSNLEQVGIYRVAAQVALFSGFVYTALNMLASQRFAFLRASGDTKALKSTAVFMARLALLGALPLPLIFFFFGAPLLEHVFGASFVPALNPMFLLFLGQIVNAFVGMASALLIMSGQEAKVIRFTVLALALNALLSWLLIPLWGAVGAATANLCAGATWNLLIWFYLRQTLNIDTSVLGWHGKDTAR